MGSLGTVTSADDKGGEGSLCPGSHLLLCKSEQQPGWCPLLLRLPAPGACTNALTHRRVVPLGDLLYSRISSEALVWLIPIPSPSFPNSIWALLATLFLSLAGAGLSADFFLLSHCSAFYFQLMGF